MENSPISNERKWAYEAMTQAAIHKLVRRMPRYDHEELF